MQRWAEATPQFGYTGDSIVSDKGGGVETKESIALLIAMLKDNSKPVDFRESAATGLGYAGGLRARGALSEIVLDPGAHWSLRRAAMIALGRATQRDAY